MRDAFPAGAIDSHVHVYGPGCARNEFPQATVAECRAVMARTGIARAVIVQPRRCGTDHTCMLNALAALGPDGRGVAILPSPISDRDLDLLGAQGVAGTRCFLDARRPETEEQATLEAARLAERGWHIDVAGDPRGLSEREVWLRRLPGRLVLDAAIAAGASEAMALAVLLRLLESGRVWVKLSGPDITLEVVHRLVAHAPDRCVWGSHWPHGSVDPSAISAWLPDDASRVRVLRENPSALYGFGVV